MEFILQSTELFKLFDRATEYGYKRARENCLTLSPHLTKQECYAVANRRAVNRALKTGTIKTVIKEKRVYILRDSFESWFYKDELLSTHTK